MENTKNKIKSQLNAIHWPSVKEVMKDTVLVVVITTVLSVAILLWRAGIETVIQWIYSIFS